MNHASQQLLNVPHRNERHIWIEYLAPQPGKPWGCRLRQQSDVSGPIEVSAMDNASACVQEE